MIDSVLYEDIGMYLLWVTILMISESKEIDTWVMSRWREDRKRNYPTQENIEKKQAIQETVEQAGGLMKHEKEEETPKYAYISVRTPVDS